MNFEALKQLMDALKLDSTSLAVRLGGKSEHYEQLRGRQRLPFAVWDALQRLAYREGYAWDPEARDWRRTRTSAATM